MTNQLPSACGLRVEDFSENSIGEEMSGIIDVGDDDSIVDRFSGITIIDQGGTNNDSSKNASKATPSSVEATHIIVLIHGWMGNPAEMGYIRESIQNAVEATTDRGSAHHRFIIHSAACNCDKTDDGIAVGGSRLAQEINELVRHVVEGGCESGSDIDRKRTNEGKRPSSKFTLSIVGNSLGGLYARHALAGIDWEIGGSESSAPPVMLIPMVFVTTATPHLGISQHTYVPLPRAAEYVVAQGMKETGRDFFQFTPVIEDLFCKDYFLNPLSSFQQRIAYINVYGTDFQVPTATAAFWAPDSDSAHYRVRHPSEESVRDAELSSSLKSIDASPSIPNAIVMMLTTPRHLDESTEVEGRIGEEKKGEEGDSKEEETKVEAAKEIVKNSKTGPADVFTSWSKRLDRIGWTKVLVDVREAVPGVRESIASAIDQSSSDGNEDDGNDGGSKSSESDPKSEEEGKDKNEEVEISDDKINTPDEIKKSGSAEGKDDENAIPDWTRKDTWTAGELLTEFKGGLLTAPGSKQKRPSNLWDWKPRLPMGHAVMIANAKDAFNKKTTSGGKPVMDYLGASLVQILQESVPSRNSTDAKLHDC